MKEAEAKAYLSTHAAIAVFEPSEHMGLPLRGDPDFGRYLASKLPVYFPPVFPSADITEVGPTDQPCYEVHGWRGQIKTATDYVSVTFVLWLFAWVWVWALCVIKVT